MRVYNTLSAKKEDFIPRDKDKVGIYVCGPTVYNYIHIGNARAYISFDTIVRYLKHKGLKVKFVRNLTDVDDKIIKRAAEENTTTEAITKKYTKAFHRDMKALGVEEPTIEPKATEHIKEMIETIEHLIERDMAYVVDGDVYFSVEKFPEYGKLSKRTTEEMLSGARVDVDERKKNPADFALWKKARLPKPDRPGGTGRQAKEGEPSWPSPWGDGRPGWHIECSTMSMKYLGIGFDIHGGGQDLIFPHHENEIAQAEGATGQKPFVRYWLHNGFLNVEEEKMAKSVGNVILINDLEEQYKDHIDDLRNDLRMLFISTHYHSPLNFSQKKLKEAAAASERIVEALTRIKSYLGESKKIKNQQNNSNKLSELQMIADSNKDMFEKAMDDDFNTPLALAAIFNLVKHINTFLDNEPPSNDATYKSLEYAYNTVKSLTDLLGFDLVTEIKEQEIPQNIQSLINERENARKNKDFEKSDEIRDKILDAGYEIKDTPQGQLIKKI